MTSPTRYLQLSSGKIAYDVQGEGPLILCAPAAGDLRSEFRFLTPFLVAAGYRVVTMDIRGQGESSAIWPSYTAAAMGSDMMALIEHLDCGPAIIVAVSKVTGAAIWLAVEVPHLVRELVLMGIFARALSPLRALLMARVLLADPWGIAAYSAFFPTMYPNVRPLDFDEHFKRVKAMLREPGRLYALRRMFSDTGSDWDSRVSQVNVPVLIMMGSCDPDVKDPVAEAHLLAKRMEGTKAAVEIIEGAGHHLPAEVPVQVSHSVLRFLEEQRKI